VLRNRDNGGGEVQDRADARGDEAAAVELACGVLRAEGIGDGEMLERLTALGCDTGQGYFLGRPMPPARALVDAGAAVALATDFNPGTSPTASLPLVMTVACLALKLSPSEALAATTINAAFALGIGETVGSLEPGKQADLAIWRVPNHRQIPYWPAADLIRAVVKRGRPVLERVAP